MKNSLSYFLKIIFLTTVRQNNAEHARSLDNITSLYDLKVYRATLNSADI